MLPHTLESPLSVNQRARLALPAARHGKANGIRRAHAPKPEPFGFCHLLALGQQLGSGPFLMTIAKGSHFYYYEFFFLLQQLVLLLLKKNYLKFEFVNYCSLCFGSKAYWNLKIFEYIEIS